MHSNTGSASLVYVIISRASLLVSIWATATLGLIVSLSLDPAVKPSPSANVAFYVLSAMAGLAIIWLVLSVFITSLRKSKLAARLCLAVVAGLPLFAVLLAGIIDLILP